MTTRYVNSAVANLAVFVGSIPTSTTLTVASITSGLLTNGQIIYNTNLANGSCTLVSNTSVITGNGVGTWAVSATETVVAGNTFTSYGDSTSWANATPTMLGAIQVSAAGDDFNVANTHVEVSSVAITWAFPGTSQNPNRVFSCTTANAIANSTTLAPGAVCKANGLATSLNIDGYVYINGLTISANSASKYGANGFQTYENCLIQLTSTTGTIGIGSGSVNIGQITNFNNTAVSFANVACNILAVGGIFNWKNTNNAIQNIIPTNLIAQNGSVASIFNLDGIDLSAMSTKTLVNAGGATSTVPLLVNITNCRLPSSVTVQSASINSLGPITNLIISDSSGTTYRQEKYCYQGTLKANTTVYRPLGASDTNQTISWGIITTANNRPYFQTFECFTIVEWFSAASHTATFEMIVDTTTDTVLNNADVWVEVECMQNASYPQSYLTTTGLTNPLSANVTLNSSNTAAWTTTGMTTPNAQNITVGFTPAIPGYVRFNIKVGRPSLTTLHIDPFPTVT